MTPKQLQKHYGGGRGAAQRASVNIGYTPQQINNWIRAGRIGYRAQLVIERATGGMLKARK